MKLLHAAVLFTLVVSACGGPRAGLPEELTQLLQSEGASFEPQPPPAGGKSEMDRAISVALQGTSAPPRGGLRATHGMLVLRDGSHRVWLVIASSIPNDTDHVTVYAFVDAPSGRELLGWNAIGLRYDSRVR